MGIFDRIRKRIRDAHGIKDLEKLQQENIENEARKRREEEERESRIRQRTEELRESSAKADQDRFNVNVIANLVVPKSKSAWMFIIALLIFLLVAWYKNFLGFRTVLLTFGVTISGIIAVSIILIFIVYGFATCKNDLSKFYIATALLLWIIDLIPQNFFLIGPYLGPEWAGFIWPSEGIWHIPWASIFLSSFFFSLLYINMVFNIIEKEYLSFSLGFSFILITNYLITKFFPNYINYGFNLYIPHGYTILFNVGVIVLLVVLGYAAWRLDRHRRGTAVPEFFSSVYMIFVFSFFWMNNGWQSNLRAILHMIFILGFGFSYMRTAKAGSSIEWKIWMPTLLIIDFFGYGFLWASDILILKFIPPVVLFVIIYCYEKETVSGRRNYTYPVAAMTLLITFFLIMSLKVAGFEEGTLPYVAAQGSTFKDIYTQFTTNIKNAVEGRLDVATGGLYRYSGAVEKNQYENLGVYFSNIRASEPKFYTDEPVTIWGSIRSKTYQDPVIVNYKCYRWKTAGDKQNRIESKTYEPKNPFLVFQLEQNDVECTFRGNDPNNPDQTLNVGQNTLTLSAEYNFATNAYKKSYFMDKDRYRALIKESIDPFKEFGIKDTQPKPVYTNGPVEIGMDIQPLNPVSDSYVVYPTLGITLANRKSIEDKNKKIITVWEGKIKNITELVVLVPSGIEVSSNIENCNKDNFAKGECPCNRPFISYDVHKCYTSCNQQVLEPCNKACSFYEKDSRAEKDCIESCVKSTDSCSSDCKSFFEVGEDGTSSYRGIALDVENIQYKSEYRDIEGDRFRTFVCRIKPTPQVLDNTPITTRYFRVRARYNYLLENSVKVTVEQAPTQVRKDVDSSIKDAIGDIDFSQGYIQLTSSISMPLPILKALMQVETKTRHCCGESSRIGWNTCIGTSETSCPADRIIKSYDGSSIGIMQINMKDLSYVSNLVKNSCRQGQTVYDRECNIKVGIAILKDKATYLDSDGRIKASKLQASCSQTAQPNRYAKYSSYVGMDAVLRAYNGLGCSSIIDQKCAKACSGTQNSEKCTQSCVDGTIGYVEKINNVAKLIEAGDIATPEIQELYEIVTDE